MNFVHFWRAKHCSNSHCKALLYKINFNKKKESKKPQKDSFNSLPVKQVESWYLQMKVSGFSLMSLPSFVIKVKCT